MNGYIAIVRAWHEALNAGNIERLIELSSRDIEVGGPRGSARGTHVLREWFARAGLHLDPHKMYHRDTTVVVEQGATWGATGIGESSDPDMVASVFNMCEGRVASVVRHTDLASALQAAGLTTADEV